MKEENDTMRVRDEEEFQKKKAALMEKCFACYAEKGLASVGIRALAEACGCSSAVLYTYFADLDDLIVQSTAHCMTKVEDDFMARLPPSCGMWSASSGRCRTGRRVSTGKNTA